LGLAPESIKRAMADLAKDGLVTRVQGKGVFVARRQAEKRFWGIVIPFYMEFYNNVIVELRGVAERKGIALEHACDYDDWKRQIQIVEDMAYRRSEAIVVVPTRDEIKSLKDLKKIARSRTVLLFDRCSIASPFPYVIQDYVQGVRLVMQTLVSSGSRRIAYVRDPLWISGNPIYRTMEKTYSQFCEDMEGGYSRFLDLPDALSGENLSKPDFDALLCVNDQVACLMTGILLQNGIDVPGKVQVAGYNNSDIGRFFTPKITTTCPDLPGMCRLVDEIIEKYNRNIPVESLQHVSMPRLIEGGTTRKKTRKRQYSGKNIMNK
jgi:DNA-binding LacI/PurR family transcriptional regulator